MTRPQLAVALAMAATDALRIARWTNPGRE